MQKLQHQERLRTGDRVLVRRQSWRIGGVRAFGDCSVVTLLGTGALNHGTERSVLAPFDRVEQLEQSRSIRRVRVRLWRRRCRALLAELRPAGALRSASHARIDLLTHQLEPALAVLRGLGSRVLIADEVGLGKTIQAALIVAELKAIAAADRVLVLAPAGLRDQWRCELFERFGVDATLMDMSEARRRAASLPVGLNPWSTAPVAVTSVDYAKRPEVLPAILACHWDVVVVDEAHGAATGSDRQGAISALTSRASYVVLLTATPHNGDHAAFEALCGFGRVADAADRLLVFRRRRVDVVVGPKRRIHRADVRSSPAERRMHDRLEQFGRTLEIERRGDPAVSLTLTLLHKRALSSAWALETSVMRRLAELPAEGTTQLFQLSLPLDDGGGELDGADEAPRWIWPALDNPGRERRLLEQIVQAAHEASRGESKLRRLTRLLDRLSARNESAIVFTEYRDTLAHVQRAIARPCVVIHGGLPRSERQAALENFRSGRHALLLATDAAGEGLNLHQTCRVVINLELPWNPMRLEQRIGRVDRIGQTRRVHAFNLIASDSGEERLFQRLRARIALARDAIGAADPLTPGDGGWIERFSAPESVTTDLPSDSVPLVRLDAEAQLERNRLACTRAMTDGTDGELLLRDSRPWQTRARRAATRAALNGHALAILRLIVEDVTGSLVASSLVPLLVRRASGIALRDPAFLDAVMLALAGNVKQMCDGVCGEWLAEVARTVDSFWRQRLAREQSIVQALLADSEGSLQPGLFDRRAEHTRDVQAASRLEQRTESQRRIEIFERRAIVAPAQLRAALLLVG